MVDLIAAIYDMAWDKEQDLLFLYGVEPVLLAKMQSFLETLLEKLLSAQLSAAMSSNSLAQAWLRKGSESYIPLVQYRTGMQQVN